MSVPANQSQEQYFEGGVPAALPLALLESVRAHDHPGEFLEEEDITTSLPRRLGLSTVVEAQIQRYESSLRARRPVSLNEVFSLVRLVLRRPDAELILRETGTRLADQRFHRTPRTLARFYRALPLSATLLITFRQLRRTLGELRAGGSIAIQRSPLAIRVRESNSARLDSHGTACSLFTATIERYVRLSTGRFWTVRHVQCQALGASECIWHADAP